MSSNVNALVQDQRAYVQDLMRTSNQLFSNGAEAIAHINFDVINWNHVDVPTNSDFPTVDSLLENPPQLKPTMHM